MMRPLTFGLALSAGSPTRAGRTTFVADLNRALRLIAGHFDSAWMIDHLQDGTDDMLESFATIIYLAALIPSSSSVRRSSASRSAIPRCWRRWGLHFLSG